MLKTEVMAGQFSRVNIEVNQDLKWTCFQGTLAKRENLSTTGQKSRQNFHAKWMSWNTQVTVG